MSRVIDRCATPPGPVRLPRRGVLGGVAAGVFSGVVCAGPPRAPSREAWIAALPEIRRRMESVMGPFPGPLDPSARSVPAFDVTAVERGPGYVRKKVLYVVAGDDGRGGDDRVPAWLLLPDGPPARRSAILCLHQTNAIGKDEPAGLGGLPDLHYADELARRGHVCLVPDYPRFGEYRWAEGLAGTGYASGSMKAIWNNVRGVDLLAGLAEVDPARVGVIGHSLGGHNAIFTAAFDQRLRAVVSSCGFTPFPEYYGGDLAGWTSVTYMPRIREVWGSDPDRVPFDFPEVIAALAPRGCWICAPLRDDNFAVDGVRRAIAEARPLYGLFGAEDRLVLVTPDAAHTFPERERLEAYRWLERILGAGPP